MLDFTRHLSTRPPRGRAPDSAPTQVRDSADTRARAADHWTRYDRFLIFGTERGTYYMRARTRPDSGGTRSAVIARTITLSSSGYHVAQLPGFP